ncbi:MAG TPA: hypothetical protein VMW82_00305 [Candidatus Paceibacterota bacterium]|nr:hypothetical protein [Candidatus Paceibacterota bacterium]
MNKKILLISAIVVIIVIVIAVIITKPGKQNGTNNTSDNKSLKNVEIAQEIYGFSAVIKNIDDKVLTLEGLIPAASGEPIKGTVEASVTDQTKIVGLKFPAEIEDKTKPVYPEETVLKLSDLKVGDSINIASATNISDNIKNGTQFPLTSIFIIEK